MSAKRRWMNRGVVTNGRRPIPPVDTLNAVVPLPAAGVQAPVLSTGQVRS